MTTKNTRDFFTNRPVTTGIVTVFGVFTLGVGIALTGGFASPHQTNAEGITTFMPNTADILHMAGVSAAASSAASSAAASAGNASAAAAASSASAASVSSDMSLQSGGVLQNTILAVGAGSGASSGAAASSGGTGSSASITHHVARPPRSQ